MIFRVKGIWRGLTWGCALAGRPSVQLALMDKYDLERDSPKGLDLHFDDLIEIIAEPLRKLQIIQIHAVTFHPNGSVKRIGDPSYQDKMFPLVTHLLEQIEHRVILHFNNQTDISMVDPRANIVLVPTLPSSGDISENYWGNLEYLSDDDEILFRIRDETDFYWMKECIQHYNLTDRFIVHMVVVDPDKNTNKYAEKLVESDMGVHLLSHVPFITIPIKFPFRRHPGQ
ncbi:MAG TPA: hypothetical protein VKA68_15230 [bacterium]|nr:hypothetical protein [bacterium]